MVIRSGEGRLSYNASSPDELALVCAAKFCGFEYQGTNDEGHMVVREGFINHTYELLAVLEFTSSRKRMSVILRHPDGKIVLLVKGADTVL